MDGLAANIEALEQCRIEMTGQTGPMASAGDGLPEGVGAEMFGGLEGAGALVEAVNALSGTLGGEIEQASSRLEKVGGALDGVIATVRETEENNAQALTPAG